MYNSNNLIIKILNIWIFKELLNLNNYLLNESQKYYN